MIHQLIIILYITSVFNLINFLFLMFNYSFGVAHFIDNL